jgi:hypothetical protein
MIGIPRVNTSSAIANMNITAVVISSGKVTLIRIFTYLFILKKVTLHWVLIGLTGEKRSIGPKQRHTNYCCSKGRILT